MLSVIPPNYSSALLLHRLVHRFVTYNPVPRRAAPQNVATEPLIAAAWVNNQGRGASRQGQADLFSAAAFASNAAIG